VDDNFERREIQYGNWGRREVGEKNLTTEGAEDAEKAKRDPSAARAGKYAALRSG
jgi:hypothetical protein